MKTAIVILNYNGEEFLRVFLPSVIENCPKGSVFVADNASTDNSLSFIKEHYPDISIISNSENLGFAAGYNKALESVDADYFVLLNSDVQLSKNWLEPLEKLADSDNTIAAIQPKILNFNNKGRFEYAGAAGGFLDFLGYAFCRGRIFDELEKDTGQYDNEPIDIFWASGACLFIKSSVFRKLRGFDPSFFAHMEEIDLCWRIHNAGLRVVFEPSSKVYHVGGGTLNKSNPFKTFLNYRNNLAMLYKNLPSSKLYFIIFFRLILDGVSGIKLLLSGKNKDFFAIIKAHFAFYGMISSLKRSTTFLGTQKLYPKSIIKAYFINKVKTFKDLQS